MKDAYVQELRSTYNVLSPEGQEKVVRFCHLLLYCSGFKADLKEATPEGDVLPSLEVTERLMKKYGGSVE